MRDLTGFTVGRLTVLRQGQVLEGKYHKIYYWICQCECGKEKEIIGDTLTKKKYPTKSCGCLYNERIINNTKEQWAETGRYHTYKYSANQRGLEFSLTRAEALTLFKKDCYYCGSPPSQTHKVRNSVLIYNGIDRLDSTKGYFLDNCVAACGICNLMKGSMQYEEFLAWVQKAASKDKNNG